MSIETLTTLSYAWLLLALLVHITLYFIPAPFGRHTSEKWSRSINNKAGWMIMEFPSLAIMSWFLLTGSGPMKSFSWILFMLWLVHYFNRTFIYPLRIRPTEKKIPLFIVFNAIFFNLVNAGLNGYYLAELAPIEKYGAGWLLQWNFITGLVFFLLGMFINMRSDSMLIHLRKPGETGYKIPHGFLFRYVSSPNLFGEIIEWTGFALMAWNLPAWTFMVWTFANLVPRARNHHDWYRKHFQEYPKERRVVFPFLY